ncbi:hypothetical protein ACFS5N_09665 [Mucilaginibacter ximonensis]|uniref:Carboxypeptidase-like regulatory domain-containing protein n=1 Tax=Mucilaginibacter ximonensis TaxID=538021 RepID=A0ABW5YCN9_9SPHI
MKYLFSLLLLLCTASVFAQQTERPLVQYSGITRNADSTKKVVIVPYVSIKNVSTGQQLFVSDYQGYFSFVAHERDTLQFTSVGYFPVTVVVPANINNRSMVTTVSLKPQIVNLPAVRVFPWATTDEFRKDFLAMKIADDDYEIIRKNLNPKAIKEAGAYYPHTVYESVNAQEMHNNIVNSHSITNPLLNPFAWGSLIRDIAAGDKSNASN